MIRRWFPYTRLRREQNCTRFTAFTLALIQALGWIFLRLESPRWQALREQHRRLYPHLADKPSTIGDPLRYTVQTLWLLLVRTPNQDQIGRQRFRQRTASFFSALLMIVQRPWNLLSNAFARLPTTLSPQVTKGSHWWDNIQWPLRKGLYIAMGVLALALIVLCITEPFGFLAQLVFVVLLWMLAMLVRRMPGRFPTLLLIVLSVIVSLSVVALYLDPELERHLRSGLRPDLAGGRNLYLADPVAGLCANLMAAQSQTGTAAGRHRSVAGSGSADSHLQRRIVGYPWHGVCGAGYRLAERQAAHPFAR